MANNEVRIIGGQWKGRKLRFASRPGLRPTLGRARETLFNWLAPDIQGARCLDLYAGSGALGFEALSRGAAEVTFVERDRKTAIGLRSSVELLGAAATVVSDDAARFLARTSDRYDVIFYDPPFGEEIPEEFVSHLLDEHLTEAGLLYLEAPRRAELPHIERRIKHASAGDCQFSLYCHRRR
jgi:16S rRNA (guanine966-N2)-methyltransferase